METLLTDLRSKREHREDGSHAEEFVIRETKPVTSTGAYSLARQEVATFNTNVTDLDSLLSFLRSKPETDNLVEVLSRICNAGPDSPLYLHHPVPKSALVTKTLVDTTTLDFWPGFSHTDRELLAKSLRTLGGINALLTSIRFLLGQRHGTKPPSSLSDKVSILVSCLVEALSVQEHNLIKQVWFGLRSLAPQTSYEVAWREAIKLFASGKILSTFAEALDFLKHTERTVNCPLSSGPRYAHWLADQVAALVRPSIAVKDDSVTLSAAQLLGASMSFGYTQALIQELVKNLVRSESDLLPFIGLIKQLASVSKQRFAEALISWLSKTVISPQAPSRQYEERDNVNISAVAALLAAIFKADETLKKGITALLEDTTTTTIVSLSVRRAVIAALAESQAHELIHLLTRTMTIFGDQLFITHSTTSQQQCMAQTILLCAGYCHRRQPESMLKVARSSAHMQGVSNRLACSSARPRWLGMVVGTAISRLVDTTSKQMDFGTADLKTDETLAYLDLINVKDKIGSMNEFMKAIDQPQATSQAKIIRQTPQAMPHVNGKQMFGPVRPPQTQQYAATGPRVVELDDDQEDEDADLKPYAKPDSDPEDSEEDATLVTRNKARPPVYIRTLMAMLREHENAEKFQLAVKHAGSLIRRKTGHGSEVGDHAEELARIIANLQDPFDTDDFDELRLQALVALVMSDVEMIAPWLSRQAFVSDYSIAQRSTILTALGLSGRELAGLESSDILTPAIESTKFPSKKLPSHLHALYGQSQTATSMLNATSRKLQLELIQPMALRAADQTTSHLDAVKVRKFSSRMEVERTRKRPPKNTLTKVFKKSLFDPLVANFQMDHSTYTSTPMLLTLYLKTLAILLHAAGPFTLELPQITSELWTLLLFLRAKAVESSDVMESILFCLLTLLDVNTNHQQIASEHARQLMETKEWVEMVFDRTGGGKLIDDPHDGESRLRSLCAAVLTKITDIIVAYQNLLMQNWTEV